MNTQVGTVHAWPVSGPQFSRLDLDSAFLADFLQFSSDLVFSLDK